MAYPRLAVVMGAFLSVIGLSYPMSVSLQMSDDESGADDGLTAPVGSFTTVGAESPDGGRSAQSELSDDHPETGVLEEGVQPSHGPSPLASSQHTSPLDQAALFSMLEGIAHKFLEPIREKILGDAQSATGVSPAPSGSGRRSRSSSRSQASPPKRKREGSLPEEGFSGFPVDACPSSSLEDHQGSPIVVPPGVGSVIRPGQEWLDVPKTWKLVQGDCPGEFEAYEKCQKNGKVSLVQVEGVDIRYFPDEKGRLVPKCRGALLIPSSVQSTPSQVVKRMGQSFASLYSFVSSAGPSSGARQVVSPQGTTLMLSHPMEQAVSTMDEFAAWWRDRASHPSTAPPSSGLSGLVPRCKVVWQDNHERSVLHDFLAAPKVKKEDFPPGLVCPEARFLSADQEARAAALQAANMSSLLATFSGLLESACEAASSVPDFDSRQVVTLAARITAGLSAVFSPTVQKLVEKAVVARIDLRGAAVPRKFDLVKSEIKALDPFHTRPCGDAGDVHSVLRKVPRPVEVRLPPVLLKQIAGQPSRRDPKSGPSGRGSSSRNRSSSRRSVEGDRQTRSESTADRNPSDVRRGRGSSRPFRGKYGPSSRGQSAGRSSK